MGTSDDVNAEADADVRKLERDLGSMKALFEIECCKHREWLERACALEAELTADKAEIARLREDMTTLQDLGHELGCPSGIRITDYLRVRVKQALTAEASESRCAALMAEMDGMAEQVKSDAALLEVIAEDAMNRGDPATWSMASVMAKNGRTALEAQERTA